MQQFLKDIFTRRDERPSAVPTRVQTSNIQTGNNKEDNQGLLSVDSGSGSDSEFIMPDVFKDSKETTDTQPNIDEDPELFMTVIDTFPTTEEQTPFVLDGEWRWNTDINSHAKLGVSINLDINGTNVDGILTINENSWRRFTSIIKSCNIYCIK